MAVFRLEAVGRLLFLSLFWLSCQPSLEEPVLDDQSFMVKNVNVLLKDFHALGYSQEVSIDVF